MCTWCVYGSACKYVDVNDWDEDDGAQTAAWQRRAASSKLGRGGAAGLFGVREGLDLPHDPLA